MADACTFCAVVAGDVDAHVVTSDDSVVAFLDQRPLFPGHVLVVPRAHHETLLDIPTGLTAPLFDAVRRVAAAVTSAMAAQGTFVAINNVVSQSVPHLHVHVVPRTKGDGLRGFFWPRQRYGSEAEMAEVAARIAGAVQVPGPADSVHAAKRSEERPFLPHERPRRPNGRAQPSKRSRWWSRLPLRSTT